MSSKRRETRKTGNSPEIQGFVLVQKVFSGSGRARRLRLMGKYTDHRLAARLEPDNILPFHLKVEKKERE